MSASVPANGRLHNAVTTPSTCEATLSASISCAVTSIPPASGHWRGAESAGVPSPATPVRSTVLFLSPTMKGVQSRITLFPVPVMAPATTTDAATVGDGDTPSYMTCKDPRTMQHPALSTVAVDAAETLEDEFLARAADGVICANDILHIRPLIRLAVAHAQASDLATMAGLAVIRGGKESQRASRLLREVDTFVPQEAA